jgi:hypothetical protein
MGAEENTSSPVTRVPLAQMEASPSRGTETAKQKGPKTRQSFVGHVTDKSTDNSSLAETLINDWKLFLNKKAMSDLTIYVEKDMEILAHKLVLYVRCKAILKDVVSEVSSETNKKTSDMLLWVDVSYKAALAFLQYLYCGLTSKILHLDEEDLLNVKKLSERYHVTELLCYLRAVNSGRGRVNGNKDSSPNLLSPCHNAAYCKKQNSLHASCPSDLSASSQAANSPKKQMYSKDTFHFRNPVAELTEKSISSGTENEFHESAHSRLCSSGSLSPDLFIEDLGEPDVKTVSQESRNSMAYLLSMLGNPSLSQSNTQNSSSLMSSDKLSQGNTQINCALMSSDKLSQNNTQTNFAPMSSDKLALNNTQISAALMSSDKLSQNNTQTNFAPMSSDKLTQNNTQINSALISSDKLSQNNTQANFAPMSSDKLTQNNTQINSTLMSLDKLSPTVSSVHKSPALQKNVTVINIDVSIPDDIEIISSSQSHDDKHVTCGKGLMCVEHVDDTVNKCDLLPSILVPDHTYTPESVSNCSPVKIKGQRNLLDGNSENSQESPESHVHNECVPLQHSWEKTVKVGSDFDGIDFLEHLLSDSHTRASSICVQRETEQRLEPKRKHPDIEAVSDHCRSFVKRVCRESTEGETIKTFSDNTEYKEESDKLIKFENDVIATLDLTQSSSDSESTEPRGLILSSLVRKNVVDTNMETEHNSTHAIKECSEPTMCNDLFTKSKENNTTDTKSHSKHFDNRRETTVGDNATTVKQKGESVEDDMQNHDDWDKFDEMCHASVPHIFSQCLSQLISTRTTPQKPPKLRISPNKHRASQHGRRSMSLSPSHPESRIQGTITNHSSSCCSSPIRKGKKISENVKEPQGVSHIERSPEANNVPGSSLLAQLNESVFWRDENAPTLPESPKQTVPSNHSNTVDHRTPVQKQTDVIFSDGITPPADYSAMKTPQLKVCIHFCCEVYAFLNTVKPLSIVPRFVVQFQWSLRESCFNYGSRIYCFPGSIVSFSDPRRKR